LQAARSRAGESLIASGRGRLLPALAWSLFVLVLPFFEGSGSPTGLLIAHLVLLAAVAASAGTCGSLSVPLGLVSVAVFAVSGLSGTLGGYRYASLLAVVDLAALLAVLVVAEALCRARPDLVRTLLGALVLSGLVQASWVLLPWIARGFS